MPITPIKMPAIAGPKTRAPLNSDEFSAMAFIRSSLPTISTTKLCRVGMSKASVIPSSNASSAICQMRTTPK